VLLTRERELGYDAGMSSQRVHVIREAQSPCTDGIDVWTMWCGEQCLAMPDGELVPVDFDFYMENAAEKSDCPGCKGIGVNAENVIPA